MNASISMRNAEAQESMKIAELKYIEKLKKELDTIFKNKITKPEQVVDTYEKLKKYESFAGQKYTITFKENTIV